MYQESREFNWISLFIKVIIFAVFILLAVWLVTKVVNKIDNRSFEKNMNILKEASVEYFKKGNFPQEKGESKKVILGDLIKMKYITSFDKNCDREKSYSQATLVDDYYSLRVELVCKDKKDYIYTSIDANGNCVGDKCDKEDKKEEKKEENKEETTKKKDTNSSTSNSNGNKVAEKKDNSNSSTSSSSSANNSTATKKTLYYEHVKVNKVYGNWQYQKINSNNVETKTATVRLNTYCQLVDTDYYLVSYINKESVASGKLYKITVRLNNVPGDVIYRKTLTNEFFNNNISMYNTYLNTTPKITFRNGNNAYGLTNNATTMMNSSLKSNNLTYEQIYYYQDNNAIYAESIVRINNLSNVSAFNNKYFIPIHIKFQYKDTQSCITDTADNASNYSDYILDSSKYETVTLYRSYSMQKDQNDTKWSTSKSIDGYVLTGKTEYR